MRNSDARRTAWPHDRRVDPLVSDAVSQRPVFRGGGFTFAASYARVSGRNNDLPTLTSGSLGVRPAHSVRR